MRRDRGDDKKHDGTAIIGMKLIFVARAFYRQLQGLFL